MGKEIYFDIGNNASEFISLLIFYLDMWRKRWRKSIIYVIFYVKSELIKIEVAISKLAGDDDRTTCEGVS